MRAKPVIPFADTPANRQFVYDLMERMLSVLAKDYDRDIDLFRCEVDTEIKMDRLGNPK